LTGLTAAANNGNIVSNNNGTLVLAASPTVSGSANVAMNSGQFNSSGGQTNIASNITVTNLSVAGTGTLNLTNAAYISLNWNTATGSANNEYWNFNNTTYWTLN